MADPEALGPETVRVIERSAAPDTARVAVERVVAAHPGLGARLEAEPWLRRTSVAVVAASRSLTRLIETDPEAVEVLADVRLPVTIDPSSAETLFTSQRRDLLRTAARDLVGLDSLEDTGAALSRRARVVLEATLDLTRADGGELAVIGMGKLGGSELNYSSDVDILFVGDGDMVVLSRWARDVVELAGHCFRVDTNLRPEGRDGALVRAIESYRAYWDRWAQPWEFQALLKARPLAGSPALTAAFHVQATEVLWGHDFTPDNLRALRDMKARAEAEVARKGVHHREIKRGRGGIRDVEFGVQLLQLVHGRHDEHLRLPGTLPALDALAVHGYVDRSDAAVLGEAYRFLRRTEHRLQLVDEEQIHLVPADSVRRTALARNLGYRDAPKRSALDAFDHDLTRHQAEVRSIHERLYFRPLLEAFTGAEAGLSPEAAAARLEAFGFSDVSRARSAVADLTQGLTRSSRLMRQLLPLVLTWLSDSPDPDLGLLTVWKLTSGARRAAELTKVFRESPETARRLCVIAGTSRLLGDHLLHNPELLDELGDDRVLAIPTREALMVDATRAVEWRTDLPDRQQALRRFTDREGLRIGAADVLGLAGVTQVGAGLTRLAEAALDAALASLQPAVPFAVVAMGRFGGAELSYASDLDVLFVYDGDIDATPDAENLAMDLLRFMKGSTPANLIYDVDLDLRPEGRQGPLARSLEGFERYFDRWAAPWERLALVRARPVAGDAEVAQRFMGLVARHVWDGRLRDDERREIRRLKARMERERIPPGEDPAFHLKLGPGSLSDVEFTAQLLQLEHGVATASTWDALERLAAAGVIDPADYAALTESYSFCEQTRNRLFLVTSSKADSLPAAPERLERLARSLQMTAPEMRDTYRKVTRRARRVVDRLFYGLPG